MGINTNVITMFGVRIPWDEDLYSDYEEIEEKLIEEFGYSNPKPPDSQIPAIFDGMLGEWIYLGVVLYDSGDFRYMDNMNDYQESDIWNLDNLRVEWLNNFRRLYPQHEHLALNKRWKLLNFIYYS